MQDPAGNPFQEAVQVSKAYLHFFHPTSARHDSTRHPKDTPHKDTQKHGMSSFKNDLNI